MASVRKTSVGRLAVMAALGLFAGSASSASAADLGGDCCADLEERIAELEATTARKGNRKVKLEVSGHVNEAVLFWDDGAESNVGVYTNDNSRTRFRFKGDAKITDDWKAGYLLEIGVRSANSKRFDQDNDAGVASTDVGLDLRHSVWYVESKTYGKLWVGLTGGAGEGVTESNLAATKDIAKYSDQEDSGLGLALRQTNGLFTNGTGETFNAAGNQALTWRRLIRDNGDQPGEGRRQNLVRYDTPAIMGFTATVNYGEDDTKEVGLRYAGEIGDFKIAAGFAYGENSDISGNRGFECLAQSAAGIAPTFRDTKCSQFGGSISVMHVESGLYVNFAGGELEDDLIQDRFGAPVDDTSTFYAVEAGIERKFVDLGKTTVFGQYYKNEGGASARRDFNGTGFAVGGAGGEADILGSELESIGVGIIQGVDAAAMHVYLTYRHYEADVTLSGAVQPQFEDLDVVMSGAIIRF
jgi:predicted porin